MYRSQLPAVLASVSGGVVLINIVDMRPLSARYCASSTLNMLSKETG